MTRRKGMAAADDPGMKALIESQAPVCTIVGKTWDYHVTEVLRVSLEENLAMIRDTVAFLVSQGRTVFYDAEHFFRRLERESGVRCEDHPHRGRSRRKNGHPVRYEWRLVARTSFATDEAGLGSAPGHQDFARHSLPTTTAI